LISNQWPYFGFMAKKRKCLNLITSAALWAIWKSRNDICFHTAQWTGLKQVTGRCARMIRDWRLIQKPADAATSEAWTEELERRARPSELTWGVLQDNGASVLSVNEEIVLCMAVPVEPVMTVPVMAGLHSEPVIVVSI
jgi:hypothetical protein